ncbi:hypothetical protein ENH_00079880 [Eimeria necatrix]|uniref:Uncharacterized protein n=1 Tax=Eimeria necatrix TaxID=51315 RepID=U6N8J6_9EIME|nr:hypothetical protein ENH_00079880 [Eimeria necatrix]CDJ70191.1 hypothetical protein ENH_00079880 [Eimeria necatrix]
MEAAEVSGAGIAAIAHIWEAIFNSLGDSACSLKALAAAPFPRSLIGFAAPLLQAATFGVLLCLHCALFTISILHPRGSLCLVPRPFAAAAAAAAAADFYEVEVRCMQWACLCLYLLTTAFLTSVLLPFSALFELNRQFRV